MAKAENEQLEWLAAQARSGDRQAFSQIAKIMMDRVVALTYRMTGDREAGLDLAQETFVSAWENLGRFRGDAAFTSWLYRIATNKALNHLKRAENRLSSRLDVDSGSSSQSLESPLNPETDFANRELSAQLLRFMADLPTQQRQVFELRYYQQLSFDEIAAIADRAEGTVKTHYRLAVEKLRRWAKEKGWQ
jgi:RNA polymerase sigma-70 factor (ECF subfamily)